MKIFGKRKKENRKKLTANQCKKRLLIIQIMNYIVFFVFLLIILLQQHNLLNIYNSMVGFYTCFLLIIVVITLIINTIYMHKCYELEKIIFKYLVLFIVILLSLGALSAIVDRKYNIDIFKKNIGETIGIISSVGRNVEFEYDYCPGRWRRGSYCCNSRNCEHAHDKYILYLVYSFDYIVDDIEYSNTYEEFYKSFETEKRAKDYTISKEKMDKIGDNITVYYNIDDPDDFKLNISTFSSLSIYIFEFVIVLFQAIVFVSFIRFYKKQI